MKDSLILEGTAVCWENGQERHDGAPTGTGARKGDVCARRGGERQGHQDEYKTAM